MDDQGELRDVFRASKGRDALPGQTDLRQGPACLATSLFGESEGRALLHHPTPGAELFEALLQPEVEVPAMMVRPEEHLAEEAKAAEDGGELLLDLFPRQGPVHERHGDPPVLPKLRMRLAPFTIFHDE